MLNEFDKRDGIKRLDSFGLLIDYANRHCSPASIEVMLQHLLSEKEDLVWLTFITNPKNFKKLALEIITIHKNDKLDIESTVIEIQFLFNSTPNNISD